MASIEQECDRSINVSKKQNVEYKYDIELPNGEINYKIELDDILMKLSPSHNSIGCAWRIKKDDKGNRPPISVGTHIEIGYKTMGKWNWKLYCTVIAVCEI